MELLNPNGNLNDGINWAPATNLVGQSIGLDVFASPGTFTPIIASNITFASETTIVNENDGTATINLKLSNAAASIVTVDVSVMLNTGTATNGSQFSYNNETVTFQIGETSKDVLITLNNDAIAQGDSYFALTISNPSGANIQGISENLIYILDDEKEVKK